MPSINWFCWAMPTLLIECIAPLRVKRPMFSQFANDLICQYCDKKNSATRWPALGDMVPFYYQTEPGRYQVTIDCPHCHKKWYVVWDDNPGAGCECGSRPTPPSAPPTPPSVESEAIRWNCDCGKRLKSAIENSGKKGKCSHCGKLQRVPARNPDVETPSTGPSPRKKAKQTRPPSTSKIPSGKVVACPECDTTQQVAKSDLGTTVTCQNKTCQVSFIAEVGTEGETYRLQQSHECEICGSTSHLATVSGHVICRSCNQRIEEATAERFFGGVVPAIIQVAWDINWRQNEL